jgi:hypothetical protein
MILLQKNWGGGGALKVQSEGDSRRKQTVLT